MERELPHLQIDPEFRLMIAPSQEIKRLERMVPGNVITIRAWENKILVDHELYSFCHANNVPMQVSRILLKTREDALIWICRNQLKRTDLTDEMRRFLLGKLFCAEKTRGTKEKAAARKAVQSRKRITGELPPPVVYDADMIQAAERIGGEFHFSPGTIRNYGNYASTLERLNNHWPKFVQAILRGNIYISQDNLFLIGSMTPAEINSVTQYFLYESGGRPTFSKYKARLATMKESPQRFSLPAGSIKEMPDFDPDAAVTSLALTIPSWVGSIQRAEKNTVFPHITNRARQQLTIELQNLTAATEILYSHLKEQQHG